jgi:hypothetical protein
MNKERIDKFVKEISDFISTVKSEFSEIIGTEITDWEVIKKAINLFSTYDSKTCIVDFIDTLNWDRVESFSFDDSTKTLIMIWHDYTNAPDNDEMQLTIAAMGAHKISCHIQIDSIMIAGNKSIPTLLIKSTYKDESNINREFNTCCSDFYKKRSRLFSYEIAKVVKKKVHDITVPNFNCYTVSLVPKSALIISSHDSKSFLYKVNMKLSIDKIANSMKLLTTIDKNDCEEIKDKGNRIRREFESVLKVLNLNREINHTGDYQKLMLGDLSKVLDISNIPKELGVTLEKVITILNQCSHDSGVKVSLEDLLLTSVFILYVSTIQRIL